MASIYLPWDGFLPRGGMSWGLSLVLYSVGWNGEKQEFRSSPGGRLELGKVRFWRWRSPPFRTALIPMDALGYLGKNYIFGETKQKSTPSFQTITSVPWNSSSSNAWDKLFLVACAQCPLWFKALSFSHWSSRWVTSAACVFFFMCLDKALDPIHNIL